MPDHKYKAKLTGQGTINNAFIYLEKIPSQIFSGRAIPILLYPDSGDKTSWVNDEIEIYVEDELEYQLNVNAVSGTGWTFVLTNVDSTRKVIDISGETGDVPEDGYNVSVREASVQPS